MLIEVAKAARQEKIKLPDLITRPVGRAMYSAAQKKLAAAGDGETVILDFNGVKVIDSSFVDEYIVKLILDSRERNYFIKLRNISSVAEINIDSVFNSYSNYKKTRMAVAREEMGANNRYYIGPLDEQESDIIDYLRINSIAGIEDISRFSGIELSSLKAVIDQLSVLRLVRRINGDLSPV